MSDKNKAKVVSMAMEQLMASERKNLMQYACYRMGSKDDAEDAVQESFLKLCNTAKDRNIRDAKAYLYRTLSNTITSIQRKWKSDRNVTLEMTKKSSSYVFDANEEESFETEYQRINSLLMSIPEEQNEVIRLRIHGGKSFVEIANILELPVTTVKSRFVYGLEKIKSGIIKSRKS
jgi:RNA polymerase sigma-70 factor (ECF subfamily)